MNKSVPGTVNLGEVTIHWKDGGYGLRWLMLGGYTVIGYALDAYSSPPQYRTIRSSDCDDDEPEFYPSEAETIQLCESELWRLIGHIKE